MSDEIRTWGTDRLVDFLVKKTADRGLMADMRAGLRSTTKMNAWPILAKFCNLSDSRLRVYEVVAGLYATYPNICEGKNMGALCRELCGEEEERGIQNSSVSSGLRETEDDVKEGPMAKRFKRLLEADRGEICELIIRIVLYARSMEKAVDYKSLGRDLLKWNDEIKRRWAQSFWAPRETDSKKEMA